MSANFLTDNEFRSMTGAFYPTGHVFAMLPSESALQTVQASVAVLSPRTASPQAILEAFVPQAVDAKATAPSVGREDQFAARFAGLARRGFWGLMFKRPDGADDERLKAAFTDAETGVAYDYGTFVIEEWISPSPQVVAIESNPV